MKPSKMFQDDKSSSKYWDSCSIIKWNKECMSGSPRLSLRLLLKLVILSAVLVGFGYFFISWLHPHSSPPTRHSVDHASIVNFNKTLSIMNSSMTEASTKISSLQKTSTLPSTNVISRDADHAAKSTDDALLTKKYVRRLIHQLLAIFSLLEL